MLRLISRITITPKDEGLDSNSTGSDLITVLSKPLQETRKEIVFDFVHTVETNHSFKDLTQTATITLPRNVKSYDKRPIANGVDAIFKRGDRVKIELGYFGEDYGLREVFTGYISSVSTGIPIVVKCEDEMFKLKQKKILWPKTLGTHHNVTKTGKLTKKSYANITKIKLKELVDDILLEGTGIKSRIITDIDINVKQFNSSAAVVLAELKKEYGVFSYFVDGVLHCGLAADASVTDTVEFVFENQIIDDSGLEYHRKDDYPLEVECESIDSKTNKRVKVTVGEPDGQHKKFFIMNATEAELRKFALSKLYEEGAYEGYRGSFLTFGEPYIRPGDVAFLRSKQYPEKNGAYQVDTVRRTFGVEIGYRQEVTINQKVR